MEIQEITKDAQTLVSTIQGKTAYYRSLLKQMEEYRPQISKQNPFVISFVGRFKTGKTSLLNALLGENFLPTKVTTATAVVTKIRYGKTRSAFMEQNGVLTPISMEKAKEIILYNDDKREQDLTTIVFCLPVKWLKKDIELRDTPGLDDSAMSGVLEHITMQAVAESDLCVLVYDSSSFVSSHEVENTQAIHKLLGGNVVFAVNKTNLLNEQREIEQVAASVKKRFGTLGNATIGKCAYFMMCSAPKMIHLNGFDIWLKNLVKPCRFVTFRELRQIGFREWLKNCISLKRKKTLLTIRSIARAGKDQKEKETCYREAHVYELAASNMLTDCADFHQLELQRKREELRKNGTARIQRGKTSADEIQRILSDLSKLQVELTSLVKESNWRMNYKSLSKKKVQDYYVALIQKLTNAHFPEYTFDFSAVTQKLNKLNFPGAKFAIFKSEQDIMKASAIRTIEFVSGNYTEFLKESFWEQNNLFLEQTEKKMEEDIRLCKSGLEEVIQNLENASESIVKIMKDFNVILDDSV